MTTIDPVTLLIAALIILAAIAYLLYLAHTFGAQKALDKLAKLSGFILDLVDDADWQSGTNAERYKYVSEQVSLFLRDEGMNLPPEIVEQMIEGAVKVIHRAKEQPTQ